MFKYLNIHIKDIILSPLLNTFWTAKMKSIPREMFKKPRLEWWSAYCKVNIFDRDRINKLNTL